MRVLLSGLYVDRQGKSYHLIEEPAKDLGDGTYLITREIPIIVFVPVH